MKHRSGYVFHLTTQNGWPSCGTNERGPCFTLTVREATTRLGWHAGDALCVSCVRRRAARRKARAKR